MDLISSIYHETQESDSMLCAQHALNNLVQTGMFSAQDLASIAEQLDLEEASHMNPTEHGQKKAESNNYDDSGFFSLTVMEQALQHLELRLVRWQSQELKDAHDKPERMDGFVLNHQLHWYTARRFGSQERFYNLNSQLEKPEWISATYLGLFLREAENQGYSIFAVVPTRDNATGGLPECEASVIARSLPAPTFTRTSNNNISTSNNSSSKPSGFSGTGKTLGRAKPNKTSTSTSLPKNRQRSPSPLFPAPTVSSNPTAPEPSTSHSKRGPSRSSSSNTPTTEQESDSRRVRRRLGASPFDAEVQEDDEAEIEAEADELDTDEEEARRAEYVRKREVELTEDEMLRMAIEESLGGSAGGAGFEEAEVGNDDVTEEAVGTGSNSQATQESAESNVFPSLPVARKSRAEIEEEAELARAMEESMKMYSNDPTETEDEDDDEGEEVEVDDQPSVEEMRKRRLMRFS